MSHARYANNDDHGELDSSPSAIARYFVAVTKDQRLINYLLGMDAQDSWAVDRDAEIVMRDPLVRRGLSAVANVTGSNKKTSQAQSRKLFELLGSLTTTRSIYFYRHYCQSNPDFLSHIEDYLFNPAKAADDGLDYQLVAAMSRRIVALNKADLLAKIYNDERMTKIIKILREQAL